MLTSIIVTCKNRLSHLKITLPTFLSQENSEVIVVDYGCAEGSFSWVSTNFPEVKSLRVDDDPIFCLSRARNIGAKIANGHYLFFVDADIKIIGNVLAHIKLEKNFFYQVKNSHMNNLGGTCIVPKDAFHMIGGYDEAFVGWGGEDKDLYYRLKLILSLSEIENNFFEPIKHNSDIRQISIMSGGVGNLANSLSQTRIYMDIKRDYKNLTGKEMDLHKRKKLMKTIKNILLSGKRKFEFYIEPYDFGGVKGSYFFKKKITYELNKLKNSNS
jgi:glycosyltransferase involved in cell wall biosynthesis